MYQCITCEDWLHHACLFGSHSNSGNSALATDDFDMLICERCVLKSSTGIRSLIDRYVGVDELGFMIIGKDGKVFGALPIEEGEEEEGDIEEEIVVGGVTNEKRKADEIEEVASKRLKLEDRTISTTSTSTTTASSSTSDPNSQTSNSQASTSATTLDNSTSSLLPSPFIYRSNDKVCIAPPLATIESPSIISQIEKEGGKLNIYLAGDWREKWCRCRDVS